MSTKKSLTSGESSPPLPTTSQQPSQISSSAEEYTKGEDDYLKEKKYLDEDDYLEKVKYIGEDDYLEKMHQKGKEPPKKRVSLKEKKRLQKEKYWEEEDYPRKGFDVTYALQDLPSLYERSSAAGVSNTFPAATPPTFEPASKSPRSSREAPLGFRLSMPSRDWGTQTESTYGSQEPSTSKQKPEQEIPTTQQTLKLYSKAPGVPEEKENAMKSVSSDNVDDATSNEQLDDELDFVDSLFTSSYHSVFLALMKELAAQSQQEVDLDISLTGQLESETRKKLSTLLKTNTEKCKEVIRWFMEKRDNVFFGRYSDMITYTYNLLSHPPPTDIEGEKSRTRHKKKVSTEIDIEWVKSKTKMNQDDRKFIHHPEKNVSRILLADESGQLYYPSGRLAMLFFHTEWGQPTYIILDDSEEAFVRGLINNFGHVTLYDENKEIWLSLSQNLGYYFAKDKSQKAWNWWNLNLHVHAPPVRSISLDINQYIKVQVKSQDEVIFCFIQETKRISLNLGTKYKFISPEKLSEMKMKAILEVNFDSKARKIQVLLGKMSKILNFLTIWDLETFIKSSADFLLVFSRRRKES